MVATSAFSGLVSSAWALASAAAIAPMFSLDCCMALLPTGEKIEADRAGLRPFGPNPMAGSFLGVLGHQGLDFGLGSLAVEKGGAGRAEEAGELGPRIGLAHVDDSDSFD